MADTPNHTGTLQETVFYRLKQTMEFEVIESLMSGNDTMCFTTIQYIKARDKWLDGNFDLGRERLGIGPICDGEVILARKQLLAVPTLVREVKEHLWTAANDPIQA